MKTVISSQIVNARYGRFRDGFEQRPAFAAGGDEIVDVVKNADGTYSVQSPDGTEWLSLQPDGTMEARPVSDPSQPGAWEKFTRKGNVLTEGAKEGLDRRLIELIVRDL